MNTLNKTPLEQRLFSFLHQSMLSPNTQKLYATYVLQFLDWCYQNDQDPKQADQGTVAEWFFEHQEWSQSTRHSALSGIKSFYRYEFGKDHPVQKMKNRKPENGPQRTLDEEELLKMFNACDTSKIKGVRNLAILTLMADTGLRVSEVSNILLNQVSTTKNELTVQIKGGGWGKALFFDYTRSCLNHWLAVRSLVAAEGIYLFTSLSGKTPGMKLTGFGIRNMVQQVAKRAGIDKTNPHAFRRAFATLAIKNGAPTRVVQVAGRWKRLEMVEHYSRSLMAEAIAPYSVVNNLMGISQKDKPKQTRNYSVQIDQDQEALTRQVYAEMLESIEALPMDWDGQGRVYGTYINYVEAEAGLSTD